MGGEVQVTANGLDPVHGEPESAGELDAGEAVASSDIQGG